MVVGAPSFYAGRVFLRAAWCAHAHKEISRLRAQAFPDSGYESNAAPLVSRSLSGQKCGCYYVSAGWFHEWTSQTLGRWAHVLYLVKVHAFPQLMYLGQRHYLKPDYQPPPMRDTKPCMCPLV